MGGLNSLPGIFLFDVSSIKRSTSLRCTTNRILSQRDQRAPEKNRENGWVSARFDDHVDIPCQSEQGQIGSFILSWDTKNGWGFLWVARFGSDQKLSSFSLLPGYVGIVASHYQDTFLNDPKNMRNYEKSSGILGTPKATATRQSNNKATY